MTNELAEFKRLEDALVSAGRALDYPATPAIAARVRRELEQPQAATERLLQPRSLRRVLLPVFAALILALALLFAIPAAREAVAQFLGLPGLKILYPTPTPVIQPTATLSATTSSAGASAARPTAAPTFTRTPTAQPFTLCCETTPADAQKRAHFPLRAPPDEAPSRVYFQDIYNGTGEQVVMVFGDPEQPRFTLYQAQSWVYGKLLGKSGGGGTLLQETQVDGTRALWFSGAPHLVMQLDARGEPIYDTARAVDANTLVWQTGDDSSGILYRVETKLPLAQAVRFAESLR